jgi:hypothetical protein
VLSSISYIRGYTLCEVGYGMVKAGGYGKREEWVVLGITLAF